MAEERFASWAALSAYIRDKHGKARAIDDDADVLASVTTASGRAITIVVRSIEVVGRPWFEMLAKIGPSQRIPAGTILARSFGVLGASYVDGTTLSLRQVLPVGLFPATIDEALAAFAAVVHDGAESNRVRDDHGMQGRATPWSDWPTPDEDEA